MAPVAAQTLAAGPLPNLRDFPTVRLARPGDIFRTGYLSAAAFDTAQETIWARPENLFPRDEVKADRRWMEAAMENPNYVVVVVEDKWKSNEALSVQFKIPKSDDPETLKYAASDSVVVGVAIYDVKDIVNRVGRCNHHDVRSDPTWRRIPGAEVHARAWNNAQYYLGKGMADVMTHTCFYRPSTDYENASAPSFPPLPPIIMLERMAVHPAYQGNGHASTLLKWGMRLAEIDGVPLGAISTEEGFDFYRGKGMRYVSFCGLCPNNASPTTGVAYYGMKYFPPALKADQDTPPQMTRVWSDIQTACNGSCDGIVHNN